MNAPPDDPRRQAPSTARNREPIRDVLARALPPDARVLELASGAGEHAVFFARAFPEMVWRPSDPDPSARTSIAAWRDSEDLPNVLTPFDIDAAATKWPLESDAQYDALIAINMVHISPWASTLGLFAGAARVLSPRGRVVLYGPYKRGGAHTAPSNEAFDVSLRARNPDWGVRDMEAVARVAESNGFALIEAVSMPANNFTLIFARA